jgi:hypothetical protein
MKKILLSISFIIVISSFSTAHIGHPSFLEETTFMLSYIDGEGVGDQINVYPNPATNYFRLKNGEDVHTVLIYNIVGRQVKRFNVNSTQDRFTIQDLNKGMYVVRLFDDSNNVIQTIRMNKI